jgi:hypothetical protein
LRSEHRVLNRSQRKLMSVVLIPEGKTGSERSRSNRRRFRLHHRPKRVKVVL